MIDIHRDYRTQIQEVMLMVYSGRDRKDIFEYISSSKIELEPIRYKIHALGSHSKSAALPLEIREFLLCCAKYLNVYFHARKPHFGRSDKEFDYEYDKPVSVPDPDDLEDCYSAMYSGLLEVISLYQSDGDIEILKNRVSNIQDLLLSRWSEVSIAYAKSRLKVNS